MKQSLLSCFALLLALSFVLCACGGNSTANNTSSNNSNSSDTAADSSIDDTAVVATVNTAIIHVTHIEVRIVRVAISKARSAPINAGLSQLYPNIHSINVLCLNFSKLQYILLSCLIFHQILNIFLNL